MKLRFLLTAVLCFSCWAAARSTPVLAGPHFSKITNSPFLTGPGAQAIAWGDCNGDGWIDVYCAARSSSLSTLFTNDTHGGFGRATGAVGANLVNPVGAAWGDVDNNGSWDLFISNNNGLNDSLLLNQGDGTFVPVKSGSIVSSAGNGNGCAWADYDRDGHADLCVVNSDGKNFLFHNNGDGTFTRVLTGAVAAASANSQGCAWVDYDGDGFPDLFISRASAPNLLFHNQGDGTFAKISAGPIATAGGSGLGFCWGDYDNDGRPDLFAANGGTNNILYHNEGGGVFTKTNSPTAGDSGAFLTVCWIDYDNDGWLDLFATSVLAETSCRLYHNNGDGTFARVTGEPLTDEKGRWFAAAWADIDNDGFPDALVSNINKPNALYRNEGNDNHWLTVRCLGRVSNRAAIGAKVRVRATIFGKTFWQCRELSVGGNIGSQNQVDPMFGLGDADLVEILRVEWPSGMVQEFHDVPARQILSVKEPAQLRVMNWEPGGLTWGLRGGKNVAYAIETSTNLEDWAAADVVTNSTGQLTFHDDATNHFQAHRAVER